MPCCICKCELRGLICKDCFAAWPKGKTFREYTSMPYNPTPVVILAAVGGADSPVEMESDIVEVEGLL
jgi:hypothetical protein